MGVGGSLHWWDGLGVPVLVEARPAAALPLPSWLAPAETGWSLSAPNSPRLNSNSKHLSVLQYVDSQFLGDLSKQNDPDARAVYTRIQTYLKTSRFSRPPEGRDMPQSDASSYDRA